MDDWLLTCTCGGETRLWNRAIGNVVQCFHCGAHVTISEDNTRPLKSDGQEKQPFSGDDDYSRGFPEETPDAPPPEEAAPALSPEEQLAASEVSLFLAEPEEQPKPKTLPPLLEPQSPPRVKIGPESVIVPKAKLDACSRCKRTFRGDWDRHDTDYGIFCNICFNLAQDMATHAVSAPPTPPPSTLHIELSRQTSWTPYEDMKPTADALDVERRKQYIGIGILALLAIITIASVLLWPGGQSQGTPIEVPATPQAVAQPLTYSVIALRVLMGIIETGVAIFFTLYFGNKLPNEGVLKNFAAIAIVAVLVGTVHMMPFVGWIIALVLVFRIYDFGVVDLILFFIFSRVAGLLVWATGALIFGESLFSMF